MTIKRLHIPLLILFSTFLFVACKNEGDTALPNANVDDAPKKELPQKQKDRVNSVMTKMMVTSELKTFTSATVTAGLTDMLQQEKGPFTIIAPSNEAFKGLPKDELNKLLKPENKGALVELLKNHIIKQDLNSADLTKSLRNGAQVLTTLGGAKLTLYKDGLDMILKDDAGQTAVIGKSDILGSNGIVHVISGVLTVTK